MAKKREPSVGATFGRPRTDPSGEAISARFEVRVTASEKAAMEKQAKREGFLSLNAWARVQLVKGLGR